MRLTQSLQENQGGRLWKQDPDISTVSLPKLILSELPTCMSYQTTPATPLKTLYKLVKTGEFAPDPCPLAVPYIPCHIQCNMSCINPPATLNTTTPLRFSMFKMNNANFTVKTTSDK